MKQDMQSVFDGTYTGADLINSVTNSDMGTQLGQAANNPSAYLQTQLNKAIGGDEYTGSIIGAAFDWYASMKQHDAEVDAHEKAENAAKEYTKTQNAIVDKGNEEMKKAYTYFLEGKHDEAIKGYSSAIATYKQSDAAGYAILKAQSNRGRTKLEKGDYRGAIVDYYLAMNTFDDMANKKIKVGGLYDLNYLEKYRLLRNRAFAKYKAGNYSGALSDCNIAMIEMPQKFPNAASWTSGTLYLKDEQVIMHDLVAICGSTDVSSKKYTEADSKLNRINEFNNTIDVGMYFLNLPQYFNYQVFLVKAFNYIQLKEYTKAIDTYNFLEEKSYSVVATFGGDKSLVFAGRANAYMMIKQYDKALEDINKAIELNPIESSYYFNRSEYKKLLGDQLGAAKDQELSKNPSLAIENISKSKKYYDNKLTFLRCNKDEAGQLALLTEALPDFPDNKDYLNSAVLLLTKFKLKDLAIEFEHKVKGKDSIPQYFFKSVYYGLINDNDKYLEFYLKALEKNPTLVSKEENRFSKYEQNPLYCKFAQRFVKLESPINGDKFIWESWTKPPIKSNPTSSSFAVIGYYNLGDISNALICADKEISGEGKDKYLKDFKTETVAIKIKCLFFQGKLKDAVQCAKKFSIPRKNYVIEENDKHIDFIKNIATDHCGYDK